MQRTGEVKAVRWADVDLAASLWTFPADVAKNGKKHSVRRDGDLRASTPAAGDAADARSVGEEAQRDRHG